MSPAPGYMTVDEYFNTPVSLTPTELIYGRFRAAESPAVRHQAAVAHLFLTLHSHVREHTLGQMWVSPLDVVLDTERDLIMQPDLFFIADDRMWIVRERIYGAPDLVVEVLSPKPRIGSTEERIRLFAENGVRECWLVHQDRQEVTVIGYAQRRIREQHIYGRRDAIRSGVLPRFAATWDEIFDNN